MQAAVEKIGFFGGSFDPIHFGHLHLAKELMTRRDLAQVWFCPARLNPRKKKRQPTPIHYRIQMVELAISGQPKYQLLDIESQRKGPSYTVDTLRDLLERERQRQSPRQIHLLLSDELIPEFFLWREAEEIVKMVRLLIGSRYSSSAAPRFPNENPQICQAIQKGWTSTSIKEISSTEIRRKLQQGEDCRDLVPKNVLDFIYKNHLYLTP
ncbi:MAG: nicotinate (nicotinamide) nucleotide adenylyltransferase [Waddliaceae bacterium]